MMECQGVGPDAHHVGGVPVVVGGRESLPQIPFIGGEGGQFNQLGVQTT
jgi:hypothetical protein